MSYETYVFNADKHESLLGHVFFDPPKMKKNQNPKNTKMSKTAIFYQTYEFESTTGARYHFAKLLLRDTLFGKTTLCINKN